MPVALSSPLAQKPSNSILPSNRVRLKFEQLTFGILHGEEHGGGPRVFAVRPKVVVQIAKCVSVDWCSTLDPFPHPTINRFAVLVLGKAVLDTRRLNSEHRALCH